MRTARSLTMGGVPAQDGVPSRGEEGGVPALDTRYWKYYLAPTSLRGVHKDKIHLFVPIVGVKIQKWTNGRKSLSQFFWHGVKSTL